jgi:hypothetical protein
VESWSWSRGKWQAAGAVFAVGKAVLTLHPHLGPLSHNANPGTGPKTYMGQWQYRLALIKANLRQNCVFEVVVHVCPTRRWFYAYELLAALSPSQSRADGALSAQEQLPWQDLAMQWQPCCHEDLPMQWKPCGSPISPDSTGYIHGPCHLCACLQNFSGSGLYHRGRGRGSRFQVPYPA